MDSDVPPTPTGPKLSAELLVVILVASLIAPLAIWPAYRGAIAAGISGLTDPLLRAVTGKPSSPSGSSRPETGSGKLARQVRSMEFRVHTYQANSTTVQGWFREWDMGPLQQTAFLRIMLQRLPEAGAKESVPSQRQDILQMLFKLTAEARNAQPENGFLWLAEALSLFYSAQDEAALLALKQAQSCPKFDPGTWELNRSEYALWRDDIKSAVLLPKTPRTWSIDLDQPLHALSRSLVLQERALLQKYNIEKAMEITLVHLGLAMQIHKAAWTPADFACARGMCDRAIEPFYKKDGLPSSAQLRENFIAVLDDQGDKGNMTRIRAWFGELDENEGILAQRLPKWRRIQSLAIWNASAVIGSLVIQTASILLAWITVVLSMRKETNPVPIPIPPAWLSCAFLLSPIAWTLSGWPAGATYLLLGLSAGWILWIFLFASNANPLSLGLVRKALTHGIITLTVTTLMTASVIAYFLQQRQEQVRSIMEQGWLR